jgi:hypothetical protein
MLECRGDKKGVYSGLSRLALGNVRATRSHLIKVQETGGSAGSSAGSGSGAVPGRVIPRGISLPFEARLEHGTLPKEHLLCFGGPDTEARSAHEVPEVFAFGICLLEPTPQTSGFNCSPR